MSQKVYTCSDCGRKVPKEFALQGKCQQGCQVHSQDHWIQGVSIPTVWQGKIEEFLDYHDPILLLIDTGKDNWGDKKSLWLKLSQQGFSLAKSRGIEIAVGQQEFHFTCSLDDDQMIVGISPIVVAPGKRRR
jgi:hypothetical protein